MDQGCLFCSDESRIELEGSMKLLDISLQGLRKWQGDQVMFETIPVSVKNAFQPFPVPAEVP